MKKIRKNKGLLLFLMLLSLAMFMWTGSAFSLLVTTIDDQTKAQMKLSNGGGYGSWVDVIGAPVDFDVKRMEISYSDNKLTFDMYTMFNHDGTYSLCGLTVYIADLALDMDEDGTYEYGIVLKDHNTWGTSHSTDGNEPTATGLDIGLYSVDTSYNDANEYVEDGWDTSWRFIEPVPGYIYGGRWDESSPKEPKVAIADGTLIFGGLVDFSDENNDGTPDPIDLTGDKDGADYLWSYTVDAGELPGYADGFDIFWGGATCANDAIGGEVPPTPEPATLLLTGFGLISLIAIGMRKSSRRK